MLEHYIRWIRKDIEALRIYGESLPDHSRERLRALNAAGALEDALLTTVPMIGTDPLVDDAEMAYLTWRDEDR